MSPQPSPARRVGEAIRTKRKAHRLSIENAAVDGGIGHMTWRKIESGRSVHYTSYYGVDRLFGAQLGYTESVIDNDAEFDPDSHPAESATTATETPEPARTGYYSTPDGQVRPISRDARSTRQRAYRDPNTGQWKIDTTFRSHYEFPEALDRLGRLNLSEIWAVSHACDKYLKEYEEHFSELQRLTRNLPVIDTDRVRRARTHLHSESLARLNEAHSRYLEAFAESAKLSVEVSEAQSMAILSVAIDELHDNATRAREQLTAARDEVEQLLDDVENQQPNTETETEQQ